MRRHRILRILRFALFAVSFVTVFSFVVMRLWNWLMPAVFGWHIITFWQAVGLLVLSKILFGGVHGPGRHMYWRQRMIERWQKMSPEERDKFCQGMRWRSGSFGEPTAAPKA
jgi:hypothetical protein